MAVFADWVASTLEDLELPRNVRAKLVNGEIVLVPVTGAHVRTFRKITNQIEERAPGWEPLGEFKILPKRSGYSPEPDVAVVPAEIFDPEVSGYEASVIPFVAEIVSPESRRRDYTDNSTEYAARGIPVYLVVDVLNAHWVLMSKPTRTDEGPEYAVVENGAFGEPIEIKTEGFAVTLDSSQFVAIRKRPTA